MTPAVAVVVPVHDQAAFLGRALGSLLAQTRTDWVGSPGTELEFAL